jgi:hypothetical protein
MCVIDVDTLYSNGISKNQTFETLLPETILDKYKNFCNVLITKYPDGKIEYLIGLAAYCLRILRSNPESEVTLDNIFKFN